MTAASPSIAIIIVTYDSGRVLRRCLDCLLRQTRPADLVIVVDNHSSAPSYLEDIPSVGPIRLIRLPRNEGFCKANNVAFAEVRDSSYVLFLNPDAFLSEHFLENALAWMDRAENDSVGCLTGTLLGFDIEHGQATQLIDSTGIFQKWYGRWYDRGRGAPRHSLAVRTAEEIPAACGALMFCRTRALRNSALPGGEVFDTAFFMYKEDIDLSLRMRAKGWRIAYVPHLICHHCRGWRRRLHVPRQARYLSSRNELRLYLRHGGRGLSYGIVKHLYVVAIEPALLSLYRLIIDPRKTSR